MRHGHRGRRHPFGQRPGPDDVRRLTRLGEGELAVPEAERAGGVLGGLPRLLSRLECCGSSPLRHATGHFRATGHPVMRSFEPGESWRWCFEDGSIV
ncbi:UBP-type zinc finger domain-containing protein [Streptomyces badius]